MWHIGISVSLLDSRLAPRNLRVHRVVYKKPNHVNIYIYTSVCISYIEMYLNADSRSSQLLLGLSLLQANRPPTTGPTTVPSVDLNPTMARRRCGMALLQQIVGMIGIDYSTAHCTFTHHHRSTDLPHLGTHLSRLSHQYLST